MTHRLLITLSLLFSLVASNAICLGFGTSRDVISEKSDPIFPEEEESELAEETELEKLRHCDLYARTASEQTAACIWRRLSVEASLLPECLSCRTLNARGPPIC